MIKQTITMAVTIVAILAQIWLIGINGLTLLSLPITMYLGLEVIEKFDKEQTI